MAKQRRARNDSQLVRKASGSAPAEGERATSAPVLAHARKLNKRVKFLQRVQESALAARATVFKRKRLANGATLSSLASLGDALPDLLAASPGGKAKPAHFLATRGPKVVRAARRTKICAAETTRYAAVLANPAFQADPIAAICNHVLAQLPASSVTMQTGAQQAAARRKPKPQPKPQPKTRAGQ